MGAVADRATTTIQHVKDYIGINGTDHDALLTILLNAAKSDADDFLGNDFEDDEGVELDIPAKVERWLLKEVARDWENKPAGLKSENHSALGPVTWAERDYAGLWSRWEPRI